MKKAVLIVGTGPYGFCLASKFKQQGFSVIMATIDKESVNQIESLSYFPIYTSNLHEENCEEIYIQSLKIIEQNSLELKYIVHTARFAFYEFTEENPPEEIMDEMYKVNSESPLNIAKHFINMNCQYVFTSSGASLGFNKDLAVPAEPKKNNKKVGTRGLKYYSYTKRKGEERLYAFFKSHKKIDSLAIIYISLMLDTKFFDDINVTTPKGNGWPAEKVANYIIQELSKGKIRIYAGPSAGLMRILPSGLIANILNKAEQLKPLK